MGPRARVLIYGFGNPGRCDDGLGPAIASALESAAIPGVSVEANYQPVLEDAAAIASHDAVLFVDAAKSGPAPFALGRVRPDAGGLGFSTHSVRPAALLALAEQLTGRRAAGYLLAVRGYDFDEFREGLSPCAERNRRAALQFVEEGLSSSDFAAYLERRASSPPPAAESDVRPGA